MNYNAVCEAIILFAVSHEYCYDCELMVRVWNACNTYIRTEAVVARWHGRETRP